MKQKANAFPAKRFFVEMLTRDIELQDAILDLLDNCVDGAMRLNQGRKIDRKLPYEGYAASIDFDGVQFSLSDNCGGIPRQLAEDYAFRMGRPDANRDPNLPTVGVYGIGMKRAIFKMGRSATISTRTASDSGFQVVIESDWLDEDNNWDLPINETPGLLDRAGTIIEVEDLNDGVARLLSDDTNFESDLEKAIAAYYGYIIEKGFSVKLNGRDVKPIQVSLLLDEDGFSTKQAIAPFVYSVEHDGVSVELAVGIYRDLPTDAEEDDALSGRPTTERAGWTIICNDRVVLHADKSRATGWGEAGVPSYHTQFVSIAGVVVFKSNDPAKLPITTTKRGVDGNSELYLAVKEQMRDGLKVFTDFTNKWKRSSLERSQLKEKASRIGAEAAISLVPSEKFSNVVKGIGGRRFKPSLPVPTESDPIKQIRFSRRLSEIRKVADFIFDDVDAPVADVGAECFDMVLRKVKK
ncbi:ATP-binding protein [Burkholderia gladioli]|uniref:ATP-binding protein n=1 Tax=Burkholderia gladioli TaxID=28095 RepID=UPI001C5D76F8|nr:ATP-binding protein [Burkholderia gladioli]MBW5284475.1 ATP-binding protein [Burkholderia gladioli]